MGRGNSCQSMWRRIRCRDGRGLTNVDVEMNPKSWTQGKEVQFYEKKREKAYELYFGSKRTSSIEKVIETDCLPNIVNEIGETTNIPYLRQGESPMREVLKEISQSKIF